MRGLRHPAVPFVLVGFVAAAAASPTIDGGFVYDDQNAIVDNPVVNGESSPTSAFSRGFWGRPLGEGAATYRPLTPLLWRALYALGGGSPLPFHLLSVLAHTLATLALTLCAMRAGASRRHAVAVGCLFAINGVGAEATAALVGHADLLSTAFGLSALAIAFSASGEERHLPWSIAALTMLACLFKESAVVFGFAAIVVLHLRMRRILTWIPAAAVVVALVAFHLWLPRSPETTTWNNSLSYDARGAERVLLGLYTFARGIAMLFIPVGAAPNHGFAAVDLSTDTLLLPAVLGAIVLLGGVVGGVIAVRRGRADVAAVLMVLFGTPLLGSGLLFPVMTDLAERLLYPAAAAAAVIFVFAADRYLPHRRAQTIALVLVALVLFLPTLELRRAWRSSATLWDYAVRVEPRAVRNRWNHANALVEGGRDVDAAFHRMIAIYIVNAYPDGVEWERVERLEAMPPGEAIIEGPAVLYDDPCPMTHSLARHVAETSPGFFGALLPRLQSRYPECAGAPTQLRPSDARPP